MFYRYYPPNSFDFIFTKEGVSLRFSQPSLLNDPFELNPCLPTWSEKFHKGTYEIINDNIGILSCSKNECSRTMWSHYAQDHTGFVIELDVEKLEHIKALPDYFRPLLYASTRPHLDELLVEKIIELSFVKDEAWKEEQEWRCVVHLGTIPLTGYDPNGVAIHTETLPVKFINRIILGASSSITLEKKAKLWIEQFAPNVQLFKSTTSRKTYSFEYIKI
ncbi:hypothetical protein MED121_08628 [Marinomonas sp. MED121]|uniref:DUF2971 domain-containing protein n=1 Tax=Marinomonas sp. MED121 TaxID=314277 RepID=UPI0000690067|nr:DUF2971 domain-containing protein [Marinomonas sp. MED121]EAQ65616.1 hypothetical protein MED121_08628 [Marinomonas sp. MED121]